MNNSVDLISRQISNELGSLNSRIPGNVLSTSCLALGVHKGGSTMLHGFLQVYMQDICAKQACEWLDIPGLLFNRLGVPDESFDSLDIIPEYILSGSPRCFIGWRNIPLSFLKYKATLSRLPSVALIRDPRDCAVSAYYSFLGTHTLPENASSLAAQQILEERQASKGLTIDLWVEKNIHRFADELLRTAAFLNCNMRLYRYEDVWYHKHELLLSIVHSLGLPFRESSFQVAFDRVNILPGKDKRGHVRKGTPGDHREKLMPQTISRITEANSELLRFFDYY